MIYIPMSSNTWKFLFILVMGNCVVFLSTVVQGADDVSSALDSPVGLWKTFDVDCKVESLVRIREQIGMLRATVAEVLVGAAKGGDVICTWCKGKRKNRPIVGMTIMGGMKKDGNVWSGGWIYDPKRDLTAKCRIELLNVGRKLKVRGYFFFFLGETRFWKRIR